MKILSANIALGLPNMDHVMPVVVGHLAFHGQTMVKLFLNPRSLRDIQALTSARRERYFREHADLEKTVELLERAQADIVILNEILPQFHLKYLEPAFDRLGYRTRALGMSTHYPDATVSTMVVSRLGGESTPIDLSWESHAGGGAGVAAVYFDDLNITVVGMHLGLSDKFPWLYKAEIEAIAAFVFNERAKGREVVLAGDWNASEEHIQSFPAFAKLRLLDATGNVPTCPTFFSWIMKPLDHIFIPANWKTSRVEALAFGSDHLALLAEVEP